MHSYLNARLTQTTRLRLVNKPSKTIVHWRNSLQKQGLASAVPTSAWPANAQVVLFLRRIDEVFTTPSGGRSIRSNCSRPWIFVTNASTVTVRKDDASAAVQAAIANVTDTYSFSGGGGLIQTTSG